MSVWERILNSANVLVLSAMALFVSVAMWSSAMEWYNPAPPPYELLDMHVEKPVVPGGKFVAVTRVLKREDCPGNFSWWITDSRAERYSLENGVIGENPPSEYTYRKPLVLPITAAPGLAEVKLVVVVTCADRDTGIVRKSAFVTIEKDPARVAPYPERSTRPGGL